MISRYTGPSGHGAMEQTAHDVCKHLECKGLMCTIGQHGLLLASSGDVRPANSGFLSSLVSKAESLHRENRPPIVTVETLTTLVLREARPTPPIPPPCLCQCVIVTVSDKVILLFGFSHSETDFMWVDSKIIITRKDNVCVGIYQELQSQS